MENRANYILVAIFVITLISSGIFVVVWLSSGINVKHYKPYVILMNESVAGLNVNAPVKYNGVDVGMVKRISLNRDNPRQVRLLVDIVGAAPVTEGTTATLIVQGLTGVAYIGLQDSDTNRKPLRAIRGEKYPVIRSAPSFLSRLDMSLQVLTTNINILARSMQTLLSSKNQAAFSRILDHLDTLTSHLASNSQRLDQIVKNTEQFSQQLPFIAKTLSQETLPAATQMFGNLDKMSNSVADLSNDIKDNPSVLLRGQTKPLLGPGEK